MRRRGPGGKQQERAERGAVLHCLAKLIAAGGGDFVYVESAK